MKNLQISVNEIKELGTITAAPRKYHSKDLEGLVKDQDLTLNFTLSDCEGEILLTGLISGTIGFECSRCLEASSVPVNIKICESFPSTSEVIDIEAEVRELLILELPEKPLCRQDCKGLCPECGCNRNMKDCGCGKENIDPRWEKLKKIIK
jgi:uncharacterized protein